MFFSKSDPGFIQATGMAYDAFFAALHGEIYLDWYLEIGCRRGRSVAAVASKTIVVDPYFRIESNVIGAKPQFIAQQMESDAFFASGFLENNRIALSFSFIDGMHLIEYALRDFINLERHSAPGGAIAIHDCCPFSHAMTIRDLSQHKKGPWTGDVWKIIPILARWRPDLAVEVLDCAKTGLVIVHGLNPEDGVLDREFDAIMAEFKELTLAEFGVERFFSSFAFTPASEVASGGFAFLKGVAQDHSQRQTQSWVSP
ncbi:MAG: class I SAM-dependent methyltransferase [Pseudomonadota bacterium]